MGTSCCKGRKLPQPVAKKPVKPVHRTQNRSRLSTRVSEKSDMSLRTQQSVSPFNFPESQKTKGASLRFQDTLLADSLNYSLSPVDDLTSAQKVAIHKLLKGAGGSEIFLGYAAVTINIHSRDKEQVIVVVGSRSLCFVDAGDFSVKTRAAVASIMMITLAPDRSGAILHIGGENETVKSDVSFGSVKFEDLLKALQQAHNECCQAFIPTRVADTQSDFCACFNRLSASQLEEAQSELAMKVTEMTTKYGLVGEAKLYLKSSTYFLEGEEAKYCLITSHAVYCLDDNFGCYGRLALAELRSVVGVTGREFLVLSSDSEEQVWQLPSSVSEIIIKAANRVGNTGLKKLKWKSAQSFLTERSMIDV